MRKILAEEVIISNKKGRNQGKGMSGGRLWKPLAKLKEIIAKVQAGQQCVGLEDEEEDYSEFAEAGLEF